MRLLHIQPKLWLLVLCALVLVGCEADVSPTSMPLLPTFAPTPPAPSTSARRDVAATVTGIAAITSTADAAPDAPPIELLWQSAPAPGHTARISAVATTPDGSVVISASDDSTIRLWDFAKQRQLAVLHGHNAPVTALALAPDGKTFVSGGADRTVIFWDISGQRETGRMAGLRGTVDALAFAPDGKTLAGGFSPADKTGDLDKDNPATIVLWDVTTRKDTDAAFSLSYVRNQQRGNIRSLAFAPDGKTLVANASNAPVTLWDMPTKKSRQIYQPRLDALTAATFAPDGKTLAVGDSDANGQPLLRLYSVGDGKAKAVLPDTGAAAVTTGATAVAFSLDGRFVAVSWDGLSTTLWNVATTSVYGRLRPSVRSSPTPATALAFDAQGRLVSGGNDITVRRWDVLGLKEQSFFRGGNFGAAGAVFAPDGKRLAAITWLGTDGQVLAGRVVGIWDATTTTETAILTPSPDAATPSAAPPPAQSAPLAAVWTIDSGSVAVAMDDGTILLWDLAGNPHITARLIDEVAPAPANRLAISNDGRYLAASTRSNIVVVWDITNRRVATRIKGRKADDRITAIAFLPPPKPSQTSTPDPTLTGQAQPMIVSLSAQGALDLWALPGGERVGGADLKLFNATIMAVKADGTRIAVAAPTQSNTPFLQFEAAQLMGKGALGAAPTPTIPATIAAVTPVATRTPGKGTATAKPTVTAKPTATKPTPTETVAPTMTFPPTATAVGTPTRDATPFPALPALLEGAISNLAYSSDGAYIAVATGLTQVALWSVRESRVVQIIMTNAGRVTAVAWSPDGRSIATTQEDGSLRLWRVRLAP